MSTEEIDQIWERHKPILWGLWIRDRKSLDELKVTMGERGFIATSKEYKKRFQKWGFSQNISKEIWKTVDYHVKKRKRDGLESDVVINGVRVPLTKVKKETCRNFYTTSELIKTPNPSFDSGTLASVCGPISFSLLDKELNWPETMPWISFSERLVGSRCFSLFNVSTSTNSQLLTKAGGIETENPIKTLPGIMQILPIHSGSNASPVQLASRLANMIPQCFPGQHLLNSQTVSLGVYSNAVQIVLQWGIYQTSNGGNLSDETTIELFDRCGIQNMHWHPGDNLFSESTFKAARERFWGAGIRNKRRDIIIWAIKSGIDPKTPVKEQIGPYTSHLPLFVLCRDDYHERSKPSVSSSLVELLLAHEVQCPSSQYCCNRHGTLLQCAIALGGLSILRVIIQRELEFTEHNIFSNSDMLQLIDSVQTTAPGVAERKVRYLLQIYEQAYYASTHSQLTLMPPANLLATLASPARLILTAASGNISLLQILNHYHGLDLNCHNEGMMFPLAALIISQVSWGFPDRQMNLRLRSLLDMGALVNYAPVSESGARYCSALHYAVVDRYDADCQLLLEHGANPNLLALIPMFYNHRYDTQGIPVTPLQLSLLSGSYECAITLLENGASLVGDEILRLALNWKLSYPPGVTDKLIMRLKSMGINIDLEEATTGRTALQIAIQYDHESLVLALICAGSSLSTLSPPLLDWYAGLQSIEDYTRNIIGVGDFSMQIGEASNSNPEFAAKLWNRFFTQIGREINDLIDEPRYLDSYIEALRFAVDKASYESSVAVLGTLTSGAYSENGSLRIACLDLINKFLARMQLKKFPDPDNDLTKTGIIFNLLHKAIYRCYLGQHEFFEILLSQIEPVAVPNSEHMLAFNDPFFRVFEILKNDFNCSLSDPSTQIVVKQLIERLLHAGFRPTTLAGLSCMSLGTLQEVKMLVNSGFDPTRRYPWSNTALQIASDRGEPDIIKFLLELEVDVDSSPSWMCYKKSSNLLGHYSVPSSRNFDPARRNALQSAVESGNQECIKLLLDAGADVNAKPAYYGGATALQLAAINGHVGIANWLISDYKADVNAPGARMLGRTALEGAAEHGRLDMVHLLQRSGCTVTGSGRRQLINAVIFSENNGYTTVAETLKNWGGWTKQDEKNRRVWRKENKAYTEKSYMDYEHWIKMFPEEEWNLMDDGECCDNANCDCCHYNKDILRNEEEDEEEDEDEEDEEDDGEDYNDDDDYEDN